MERNGKENPCEHDHDPREHTYWKHEPGDEMKAHHGQIGERQCFTGKEKERNTQVVDGASPTEHKGGEFETEESTYHRPFPERDEPRGKWFCPEKPIVIQFGNPSKEVNNAELQAQSTNHPKRNATPFNGRPKEGINREPPVCRKKGHQQRKNADEIIVIEVVGHIYQFHIGEGQKEQQR